jgi:hypothetical protein
MKTISKSSNKISQPPRQQDKVTYKKYFSNKINEAGKYFSKVNPFRKKINSNNK